MPKVKKTLQNNYKFCPLCGGRLHTKKYHGTSELVCDSCKFVFWMNSKPTASLLLVQSGKVLLVKRAVSPYKGYWDAPGGFLDVAENPVLGLQREMREELGIHVINPKLQGIYLGYYPSQPPQSTFNVYYVANKFTGKLKPQDDVASFTWYPIRHLPKIAFANNRQALRDLQKIFS